MIHMDVTLKNGTQGTLIIDTKAQNAVVTVNGVNKLVLFVRNNKIVTKNDMILKTTDLTIAKAELTRTLKPASTSKKGR